MPSEITARCYCGALSLTITAAPGPVTYCHCADCKRWTGAPLPAFAAFPSDTLDWHPAEMTPFQRDGVKRWTCPACGSAMAATFPYLPDQTYIPLGVIDQIDALAPQMHCHDASRVPWASEFATLPTHAASGRDTLNKG